MGNTFEVWAYVPNTYATGYEYQVVYQGENLIRALLAARRAKRSAGCVKLEWR